MNMARIQQMLADAEYELAARETDVAHLRQVVDGLRGLVGPSRSDVVVRIDDQVTVESEVKSPSTSPSRRFSLKPAAAVAAALEAHPNQAVEFKALWSYIQSQGWDDPKYKAYRNAADAAARRLARNSNGLRRLDDGRYLLSVDVQPSAEHVDDDATDGQRLGQPELPALSGSGQLASAEAHD